MQSFSSMLAQNHGVAIRHGQGLNPLRIESAVALYGKINSYSSYVLTNNELLTLVYFEDAPNCEECYNSLRLMATDSRSGVKDVAWAPEQFAGEVAKRSYVKRKWMPEEDRSGYLVLFWGSLSQAERSNTEDICRGVVTESYKDDREGGRLFMQFDSEEAADDFRQSFERQYPSWAKKISYSDRNDFSLAKRNAP